jgi:hypothetical protein
MIQTSIQPLSATAVSTYPLIQLEPTGRLMLTTSEGTDPIKVRPLRLFPVSDPDHWISLIDDRGQDVLCLEDPRTLPPHSLAALEKALHAGEFVPNIRRIIRTSGNSVPCQWEVETDRGETVFIVKDEKDVRSIGADRVLVIDAHGIRYQILNVRQLDAHSRRVVEWYV